MRQVHEVDDGQQLNKSTFVFRSCILVVEWGLNATSMKNELTVRALWCLHNFLNFVVVGAAVAGLSMSSLCFC